MARRNSIFITGTDTNVGKTVAMYCLGAFFQSKGLDVGVMKPVQCGGNDAAFLQKRLNIKDDLALINPVYVKEPLSPHLALRRAKRRFDLKQVLKAFVVLKKRHDIVLVEGAGGLMVPLADGYYNADLAKDLNAEVIIVARLGLGTINHTLLTINQAKAKRLKILGVLFSDNNPAPKSIAEKTNPREIERLSGVKVLGVIPYLK